MIKKNLNRIRNQKECPFFVAKRETYLVYSELQYTGFANYIMEFWILDCITLEFV
jgi:hypothetical protein